MPKLRTKLHRLELNPNAFASSTPSLGVRGTSNMWVDLPSGAIGARPPFLKLTRSPIEGEESTDRALTHPWTILPFYKTGTADQSFYAVINKEGPFAGSNRPITLACFTGSIRLHPEWTSSQGLNVYGMSNITEYAGVTNDFIGYGFKRPKHISTWSGGQGAESGIACELFGLDYRTGRGFLYKSLSTFSTPLTLGSTFYAAPNQGEALSTFSVGGRWGVLDTRGSLVMSATTNIFASSAGTTGSYIWDFTRSGIGASSDIPKGAIAFRDKYVITWTQNNTSAWEVLPSALQFVSSTKTVGSDYAHAGVAVGNAVVLLTSAGLVRLDQEPFKTDVQPTFILQEFNDVITRFIARVDRAVLEVWPYAESYSSDAITSCYYSKYNAIVYMSPILKEILWVSLPSTSNPKGFVSTWPLGLGVGITPRCIYTMVHSSPSSMDTCLCLHTFDDGVSELDGKRNRIWVLADHDVEYALRGGLETGPATTIATRNNRVASSEDVQASIDFVIGDGITNSVGYTGVEVKEMSLGFGWYPRYPSVVNSPSVTLITKQDGVSGIIEEVTSMHASEIESTRIPTRIETGTYTSNKNTRRIRIPYVGAGGTEIVLRFLIESQNAANPLAGYSSYIDSLYVTLQARETYKIDQGHSA